MSVTLFADNRLRDTGAVFTANPVAAATHPLTRLSDLDQTLQYEGSAIGQTDLDLTLLTAGAASGWALVNPNITGVTVTLYGDDVTIGTTSQDTGTPAAAHILETFTSATKLLWRLRIPTLTSVVPKIGELVIGVPRVISQNPALRSGYRQTVGNVKRWRSPGGTPWAAQLGDKRARYEWEWNGLSEADLDILLLAFDDVDQGAHNLLVKDQLGTLRWMSWLDEKIVPVPHGGGLFDVSATFEEAP